MTAVSDAGGGRNLTGYRPTTETAGKLTALFFSVLLVSAAVVGQVSVAGSAVAASGNTDTLDAAGNTASEGLQPDERVAVPTENASGTPQVTVVTAGETRRLVALEGQPSVVGPASGSLWGRDAVQVPYVDGSTGALRVATADGGVETVVPGDATVTPKASKSTLAVARWNTTEPTLLFADANKDRIYRVAANGTVTAVADPANGVGAVTGVGDIDGDGTGELVFADGSQAVRYVEPGDAASGTYAKAYDGAGSNNGVGIGAPADFDGDGTASVPIVDGSNQVRLVDAGGSKRTLTGGIATKSPVAPADVDGDGAPEVVFGGTNGNVSYVDDVAGSPTARTLVDGDRISVLGSGLGVAFTNGTAVGPDTDGDGVPDERERELGTNVTNNDTDGDGISDGVETNGGNPVDTDNDGRIDALDRDSDDDGVPDRREGTVDTDGDGIADFRDLDDDGAGVPTRLEVTDGRTYSHDVDFDGTPNWLDTDADGDGVPDGEDGTGDADGDGMPNYLDNDRDNDGLPDSYELNVTGTDPADNDSATDRIPYDAADNDVIDGMEDFDADTLGNYREYTLGTDPFDNDTDGGGLTDGFESRHRQFDPLDPDTDGDGVTDGAGDLDGDGLSNAAEDARGTLVAVNDTDRDGIPDGAEVANGTDPTAGDTDSDGLADASEPALGTDPTDPDTDDDGVLDGNETFTTTASNESLGARVAITGPGDVASATEVGPSTSALADPAYAPDSQVSPFVEFRSARNFSEARITIGYDESALGNESDAALYRLNESLGTYERLDSTVDAANDTVSATTPHFSTYVVFNETDWRTYLESRSALGSNVTDAGPLPGTSGEFLTVQNVDASEYPNVTVYGRVNTSAGVNGSLPASRFSVYENGREYPVKNLQFTEGTAVDVVFVFDDTGSMYEEIDDMQNGVSGLISSMEDAGIDARYGLVTFKDSTEVDQPLTSDASAFKTEVNDLYASGGGDGPEDSLDAIHRGASLDFRNDSQTVVIHIMDYSAHSSSRTTHTYADVEDRLRTTGSAFYTVSPSWTGFDMLANDTGGIWMDIYDSDFGVFLDDIESSLTSRYAVTYETERPADGTGRRVDLYANDTAAGVASDTGAYIAPNRTERDCTGPDSDGDGLSDRCERLGIPLANGPVVTTDATDPDTDGDGIPDGAEVNVSDPVEDGVGAFVGYAWASDPTAYDTDGDGLSDETERDGWSTTVATSAAQGDRYKAATQDSSRDATDELTTITVSSDPRDAGSDADGVGDFVEYRNGMDPESTDTDGDTIPDGEELRQRLDPVIHDHTAPAVNPQSISADNTQRTSYTLTVSVVDDSAVRRLEFIKKGSVQYAVLGDGVEAETYHDRSFTVERDTVDKIFTGISGFATPVTVDARAVDVHDNEKRQTIKGPDSFGQAARVYDKAPIDAAESGLIGLFSFSSGVTTVVRETVVGIVELVKDPLGYVDQMRQFAEMFASNPEIITKLPQLMLDSIREQHETRNPFDRGEEHYDTFGGGWALGYSTGTVAPAFASGGGSIAQKGLSSSRKLQRLVSAVDKAVPSRVPNGVRPGILRRAGKIDDTLPDADVRTGRLSAKLNDLPGPKREAVTEQFDRLDSDTKDYLGRTDVDAPASKSADLFKNTGPAGRRALDELAERDPDAADALLKVEDGATQRRFVRAYERGEVDGDELATAVKRYDGLDANGREAANDLLAATGDDGAEMMADAEGDTVKQVMADGGIDAYERSLTRLYGEGSIDGKTLDRVDNTVRGLNEKRKANAKDLIAETDGAGVKLIDELDSDGLQRVLDLDIDRADEFRTAAARNLDRGNADTDDIEKFAKHADNLESVDGLNSGPVDDFVEAGAPGNAGDPGNVKGALREVRRADEIGSENIRRMSLEIKDSSGIKGELDIQLKSGKIIESKSSFGFRKAEVDEQFETQLCTLASAVE